jgi:hypothetical protein
MKKSWFAFCLVLLAFGSVAAPLAAEGSVVPSPLRDGLSGSCAAEAVSPTIPLGLPEWLDAAGCCPRTCNVNSDCDARCGQGFGECRFLGTCCSFCLCSLGGTSSAVLTEPSSPLQQP